MTCIKPINFRYSSTMPITSSVQTPEMFKGTLKDYQLKGLQWLVNCYEQVNLFNFQQVSSLYIIFHAIIYVN